MSEIKVLVVDDDEIVRATLTGVLEQSGFGVTSAANVPDALKHISGPETYDVLLSDLHMPGAGDGLTVVSAMRHANPKAVTIVLSAYPDMTKAAAAIVKQADEVILKPVNAGSIVEVIHQLLAQEPPAKRRETVEAVANILERETPAIMEAWLARMENAGWLAKSPLTLEERREHLPDALRDIIFRLRYPEPMGSTPQVSMAALQHGARRRRQGLGAATIVEEARALQIALFHAIGRNMDRMDLGQLPGALM